MRGAGSSACVCGGPGAVPEKSQGYVDVVAQRVLDSRPRLLRAHQGLPRVEVLLLVEVAARDVGVVLQARHREEVVSIGRFPDVDEVGQRLAVVPQVTGADLDPPRRPVMRMAGDAEAALATDLAEDP